MRLGIETIRAREVTVVRKRVVPGLAVRWESPIQPAVLHVQVQPVGELDQSARGRPARVLPLADADWADAVPMEPAGVPSNGALDDPEGPLLFSVSGELSGLIAPGSVLVELALSDGTMTRKVVPYASILYDVRGDTWVYASPEPLVFVRHAVVVDYIDEQWAVLSDGPPAGTPVVSVGVAELLGTEFKIGK